MEQFRKVLRYHNYDYRTEQTYCQWILHDISEFELKVMQHKTPDKNFVNQYSNLRELLGHADVRISKIYTHVMARDIRNLQSL